MGREPRYADESDAVDALLAAFDGGAINQWVPRSLFEDTRPSEPEFEGQVGIGRRGRFVDEGTTAAELILVFESAEAADVRRVREYVDEHDDSGEQFGPWADVTVRQRGRLVVVAGRVTRE